MCMMKMFPLLAIVPISVLLTFSFFVLYLLRKVEEKPLKTFGHVVVVFLWLAVLVLFAGAIRNMDPGRSPMKCMKQARMHSLMQKEMIAGQPTPERIATVQVEKKPVASKCSGNKGIIYQAD